MNQITISQKNAQIVTDALWMLLTMTDEEEYTIEEIEELITFYKSLT